MTTQQRHTVRFAVDVLAFLIAIAITAAMDTQTADTVGRLAVILGGSYAIAQMLPPKRI